MEHVPTSSSFNWPYLFSKWTALSSVITLTTRAKSIAHLWEPNGKNSTILFCRVDNSQFKHPTTNHLWYWPLIEYKGCCKHVTSIRMNTVESCSEYIVHVWLPLPSCAWCNKMSVEAYQDVPVDPTEVGTILLTVWQNAISTPIIAPAARFWAHLKTKIPLRNTKMPWNAPG